MTYFLIFYFVFNAYFTAILFHDQRNDKDWPRWLFILFNISTHLFFLLFLLPFMIACYVWDGLVLVSNYFQIAFFFKFYFTQQYHNLCSEDLEKFNYAITAYFNTDSFRHSIYRKCVSMINKRHNYTYNPK